MKLKKIYLATINVGKTEKYILVKECSHLKKMIKIMVGCINNEYKNIVTERAYYFKNSEIIPFELCLDNSEMKKHITVLQATKLLEMNEDKIKSKLYSKNEIGFKKN